MKLNINRKWLLKAAELEENCCISVGGYLFNEEDTGYQPPSMDKVMLVKEALEIPQAEAYDICLTIDDAGIDELLRQNGYSDNSNWEIEGF